MRKKRTVLRTVNRGRSKLFASPIACATVRKIQESNRNLNFVFHCFWHFQLFALNFSSSSDRPKPSARTICFLSVRTSHGSDLTPHAKSVSFSSTPIIPDGKEILYFLIHWSRAFSSTFEACIATMVTPFCPSCSDRPAS